MTAVARRYADALFEAAKAADAVDPMAADLEALHGVVADPAVRTTLEDRSIPHSARVKVFGKLADGRHGLIGNFLKVLLKRDRSEVLGDVWPAFRERLLEARGEADGLVECATPLADTEVQKLQDMASKLSGKTVHLTVTENHDLLAGIRLRIGNTLFDGSAASALAQMEKALMAAPPEGAR